MRPYHVLAAAIIAGGSVLLGQEVVTSEDRLAEVYDEHAAAEAERAANPRPTAPNQPGMLLQAPASGDSELARFAMDYMEKLQPVVTELAKKHGASPGIPPIDLLRHMDGLIDAAKAAMPTIAASQVTGSEDAEKAPPAKPSQPAAAEPKQEPATVNASASTPSDGTALPADFPKRAELVDAGYGTVEKLKALGPDALSELPKITDRAAAAIGEALKAL